MSFSVQGVTCAAWHFAGKGTAFEGPGGRPCVVMAHGFGGTRDTGLVGFAEAFASAGLDVLLFDYRYFGASGGEPRQFISADAQLEDYRAAITAARVLAGVDPDRVVLWGVSFSGGHVLQLAAEDQRIAAVISLTPAPAPGGNGEVSLAAAKLVGRLMSLATMDAIAGARNKPAVMIPLCGEPGTLAALTAPGAAAAYLRTAGPTWRNEFTARTLLTLTRYKPIRYAEKITAPLLVQVADFDQSAPPAIAMDAARKGRAEVRHYPADHFDVYPGAAWHETAVEHELAFLRRHLGDPQLAELIPVDVQQEMVG